MRFISRVACEFERDTSKDDRLFATLPLSNTVYEIWHNIGPRFLDNLCVHWVTSIHIKKKLLSIMLLSTSILRGTH